MKLLFIFLFGLISVFVDLSYVFGFLALFRLYFIMNRRESFSGIFFSDSLSYFLVFLTFLIFIYCFFSRLIDKWTINYFFRFRTIMSFIFFCLFVSFFCLNLFVFYVIFEFIFILMFIFLLSWGYSPERLQASFYIVFYTIVVSFPFLIYIIIIEPSIFSIKFRSIYIYEMDKFWWFFLFIVFLVKLPTYGVHLWLPKAHVEAPVSGSIVLAGVLLKLGGYGMFRFSFMCKIQLQFSIGYFISIGLVGRLVRCFLCIRQSDLKSLVAYSSVCHMGFFLSGIFRISTFGQRGRVFILIAHGFCSSCFFYILYILYERFHSRRIIIMKGILYLFPSFTIFWFIFSVLNIGVPPSFSFFSEVSILVGVLGVNFIRVFLVIMILLFAGIYCIFLFTISCHGTSVVECLNYNVRTREYLNIYGHLFPLLFIPLFIEFFC
jgi:NADH-ubiquinone oxidoreductase chain 4